MSPKANPWRTTILVNNIHCASCVVYIREILQAWEMTDINVNVYSQETHFEHEPSLLLGRICVALSQAGFEINSAITTDGNGEKTFQLDECNDPQGWWSSFTQGVLPPVSLSAVFAPTDTPKKSKSRTPQSL